MKILLITEFFPDKKCKFSGGVEARAFYTALYLAKKHQVVVISRRKEGESANEENQSLRIIRLGKENSYTEANFLSIIPRFIFIIQSLIIGLKYKVDLIEGSNFICLIPSYLISLFQKKPAIAWYPDVYGNEWIKNFDFITGSFGWLLEKIGLILPWAHVIALSEQTKKKLISNGINEKKISVVYGGVDVDFIRNIKAVKSKEFTICCISRLVAYKNIDCLIRAISLIKLKFPHIKCIIIGKGPEKKRLVSLSKQLLVAENIDFKQNMPYEELMKLLKSSQVFCLPSRIEGFGLTTIEALAANTPFVIADTKINWEITKRKGGIFFKNGSHKDLANKIIRILTFHNLDKNIIKETNDILKFYSWEKIACLTEKVYANQLKEKKY